MCRGKAENDGAERPGKDGSVDTIAVSKYERAYTFTNITTHTPDGMRADLPTSARHGRPRSCCTCCS